MKQVIAIMLVLIIFSTTLLIGIPQSSNTNIINILISITAILTIINNRKDKKIKLNIIDIFMAILAISSIIPIIIGNQVSLNNSIEYVLRYSSVLLMYFIIRKEVLNNPKLIKYIINSIIISACFLVLCGIDLMTTQKLENIVSLIIGHNKAITYELRMGSLFLYPNALAVYLSMAFLLILGQLTNEKNKKNVIYLVMLMWMLVGIVSAESRLGLACLICVTTIYLILNRGKQIRYIIPNLVLATLFTVLMKNFILLGMYGQIWILFIVFSVITFFINYGIYKIINISIKWNTKSVIIISITLIAIVLVILNIKSDLVLFKGENATNIVLKEIGNINNKQNYEFELDIDAKSNIDDNFSIIVVEQNEFSEDTIEHAITLDNFTGTKTINVQPSNETQSIGIYFKSQTNSEYTELRIKKLTINDKEYTLNYKFLPTEFINKIIRLNLNNNSVIERLHFLGSAIRGAIDNYGIGIGGGGWEYVYSKYVDYKSNIIEVHSYIGQLMIELGVIGVCAYLGIIILGIIISIKYLKENKENKEIISVMMAILMIVLHSILDLEMSFFLVMMITYMMIAILVSYICNNNNIVIKKKIVYLILIIIIILNSVVSLLSVYSRVYVEPKIIKLNDYVQKLTLQQTNVKLNPYNLKYKETEIKTLQIYKTMIKDIKEEDDIKIIVEINNLIKEIYNNEMFYSNKEIDKIFHANTLQLIKYEKTEIADKYINIILAQGKNIGIIDRYKPRVMLEQLEDLKQISDILIKYNQKEIAIKFEEIIKEKYEIIKCQIMDYKKCKITQKESESYLNFLESSMR